MKNNTAEPIETTKTAKMTESPTFFDRKEGPEVVNVKKKKNGVSEMQARSTPAKSAMSQATSKSSSSRSPLMSPRKKQNKYTYLEMIVRAIRSLRETKKGGSSQQGITKYIRSNFFQDVVDFMPIQKQIGSALKTSIKSNKLTKTGVRYTVNKEYLKQLNKPKKSSAIKKKDDKKKVVACGQSKITAFLTVDTDPKALHARQMKERTEALRKDPIDDLLLMKQDKELGYNSRLPKRVSTFDYNSLFDGSYSSSSSKEILDNLFIAYQILFGDAGVIDFFDIKLHDFTFENLIYSFEALEKNLAKEGEEKMDLVDAIPITLYAIVDYCVHYLCLEQPLVGGCWKNLDEIPRDRWSLMQIAQIYLFHLKEEQRQHQQLLSEMSDDEEIDGVNDGRSTPSIIKSTTVEVEFVVIDCLTLSVLIRDLSEAMLTLPTVTTGLEKRVLRVQDLDKEIRRQEWHLQRLPNTLWKANNEKENIPTENESSNAPVKKSKEQIQKEIKDQNILTSEAYLSQSAALRDEIEHLQNERFSRQARTVELGFDRYYNQVFAIAGALIRVGSNSKNVGDIDTSLFDGADGSLFYSVILEPEKYINTLDNRGSREAALKPAIEAYLKNTESVSFKNTRKAFENRLKRQIADLKAGAEEVHGERKKQKMLTEAEELETELVTFDTSEFRAGVGPFRDSLEYNDPVLSVYTKKCSDKWVKKGVIAFARKWHVPIKGMDSEDTLEYVRKVVLMTEEHVYQKLQLGFINKFIEEDHHHHEAAKAIDEDLIDAYKRKVVAITLLDPRNIATFRKVVIELMKDIRDDLTAHYEAQKVGSDNEEKQKRESKNTFDTMETSSDALDGNSTEDGEDVGQWVKELRDLLKDLENCMKLWRDNSALACLSAIKKIVAADIDTSMDVDADDNNPSQDSLFSSPGETANNVGFENIYFSIDEIVGTSLSQQRKQWITYVHRAQTLSDLSVAFYCLEYNATHVQEVTSKRYKVFYEKVDRLMEKSKQDLKKLKSAFKYHSTLIWAPCEISSKEVAVTVNREVSEAYECVLENRHDASTLEKLGYKLLFVIDGEKGFQLVPVEFISENKERQIDGRLMVTEATGFDDEVSEEEKKMEE